MTEMTTVNPEQQPQKSFLGVLQEWLRNAMDRRRLKNALAQEQRAAENEAHRLGALQVNLTETTSAQLAAARLQADIQAMQVRDIEKQLVAEEAAFGISQDESSQPLSAADVQEMIIAWLQAVKDKKMNMQNVIDLVNGLQEQARGDESLKQAIEQALQNYGEADDDRMPDDLANELRDILDKDDRNHGDK